ncbi:hypothetical protein DN389_21840 [Bacillus sp. AY3-1]|uniref:hypothetical protein n=1 Tax=Bacillus cereus group TaxID=86661 RepID=UPI000BFE6509|nr:MULTISPECIES: hypothetical protein [Bacillus cereus group]KAA0743411.1 hypothetical protein DN389_21840 [Bacillus sp. AY3-1]MCP9280677.1 hypothetical protein [Bacillus wiedmannii]PHB08792.1 hypothetical protein COE81_05545 [Bacillus wiedmannii]
MFLPITTFYRFIWLRNVASSSEKVSKNQTLLRAEEQDDNLRNKKYIDSVTKIHKEINIDFVKCGANYVSGCAEPHSTIVITSGDMYVGSGRVNKYGEFKVCTNDYLERNLVIEIQLIIGGFYQESITVKIER